MKFKELTEVARATGTSFVIPTDGTLEGDAMWGFDGFNARAGRLEPQVEQYVREYLGEDFEEYLNEDNINFLPTHVWIVPEEIHKLIASATRLVDPGGDSAAYAMNSLIKGIYMAAATNTVEMDWSYLNPSL